MSRAATRSSDKTRCQACGRSTRSVPREAMRERLRSRASSTGITRLFYLVLPTGIPRYPRGRAHLPRQIQDGPIASEEPATTQDEEREEGGGDQDVGEAVRNLVLLGDRREYKQHALEKDGRPPHEQNHLQHVVARGRPTGQPLEQVAERDQPSDDEDRPCEIAPRLVAQEAPQEEAGFDRHVAVP